MARLLIVAAIFCLAFMSAYVPAAPLPDSAKSVPFFPLTVGSKWVYVEGDEEIVDIVTAVERKGPGTTLVTVRSKRTWRDGATILKVEVSDKGLFRVECAGSKDNPPVCWLRLPADRGSRWSNPWPRSQEEVMTVLASEVVIVPAGRFLAVPVEVSFPPHFVEFERPTFTRWYAVGVGLIKQAGTGGGDMVLKSFTPGKDRTP
jgi:hypothetical protein